MLNEPEIPDFGSKIPTEIGPDHPDFIGRYAEPGDFPVSKENLFQNLRKRPFQNEMSELLKELWGTPTEDGITVCVSQDGKRFSVIPHVEQTFNSTKADAQTIENKNLLPIIDIHRQTPGSNYSLVISDEDLTGGLIAIPEGPTDPNTVSVMIAPFSKTSITTKRLKKEQYITIWVWQDVFASKINQTLKAWNNWFELVKNKASISQQDRTELLSDLRSTGMNITMLDIPQDQNFTERLIKIMNDMNFNFGYPQPQQQQKTSSLLPHEFF